MSLITCTRTYWKGKTFEGKTSSQTLLEFIYYHTAIYIQCVTTRFIKACLCFCMFLCVSADVTCPVLALNKDSSVQIDTHHFTVVCIHTSAFFSYARPVTNRPDTNCRHRCLYLFEDQTAMHLAQPKRHLCLVCINCINKKDQPSSALC